MIEHEPKRQSRIRYVPFNEDDPWRQLIDPHPDSLETQDPDILFLNELAQVEESALHESIHTVVARIGGPTRNVKDITINKKTFRRPIQTQFVLLEMEGKQILVRYNPDIHGIWNDISDTTLTPREYIEQLLEHTESTPGMIQDFLNERKKHGGASKTHWKSTAHPKITSR